jgi:hypothetical protein
MIVQHLLSCGVPYVGDLTSPRIRRACTLPSCEFVLKPFLHARKNPHLWQNSDLSIRDSNLSTRLASGCARADSNAGGRYSRAPLLGAECLNS